MLSKFTIRNKILLMPIISGILFTVIVIIILLLNERNTRLTDKIQSFYYPQLTNSRYLESEFVTLQRGLQDAVAAMDTLALMDLDTLSFRLKYRLAHSLSARSDTVYEKELNNRLSEYSAFAIHNAGRLIREDASEDLIADLEAMTRERNSLQLELAKNLDYFQNAISKAFQTTRENYNRLMLAAFLATGAGLFILIWTSIAITQSIIVPLNEVGLVANEVGAGNLDIQIITDGADEIGVLKEAFRKMINQIRELISEKDRALQQILLANTKIEIDAKKLKALNIELNRHRDKLELLVEERTAELQKTNIQLGDEIKMRKSFQKKQSDLLRDLESINGELRDFAYIVSHDLKAPLRAIGSLTDWLAADYEEMLDDAGKVLIRLLNSRVRRMHHLIEGILQYSRIGRYREEVQPVDLNNSLSNVLELLAPPPNITIDIENELPVIQCEKTRIEQVFQNLISNAIKYMDKPEGLIRIGSVMRDDGIEFYVSDNGPGIEEKYFDKIFKIFQTLTARDEFESTGIGLSVIKKIIEMYNGRIWLTSEPGSGTTFYFLLPQQQITPTKEKILA